MNVWSRAGPEERSHNRPNVPSKRRGEELGWTRGGRLHHRHHLPPSSHVRPWLLPQGRKRGSGAFIAGLNPLNLSCTNSSEMMETPEACSSRHGAAVEGVEVREHLGGGGTRSRRGVMEREEGRGFRQHRPTLDDELT